MDLSLGSAVTTLQPGHPLRLQGARGRRISCVQGTVWITQDGDLRDTLLAAGADFSFAGDGVAVVQALGDTAMITCEDGLTRATVDAKRPGFWARLRSAWQMQNARRALASLSDRELHDIGIRRSQIDLLGI